jgi:prevent-host-death family protein
MRILRIMATLTVTEAVRNFSDVINRIRYAGETITLTKGNKPVARIVPAKRMSTGADLLAWATDPNRPRITPEDAEAIGRNIDEFRKHMNVPPVNKWNLY